MHCVSCQNRVTPDERFCSYCGAATKPGPWRPTARLFTVVGLVALLLVAVNQVYHGLEHEQETRLLAAASTTIVTPTTAVVLPTSVAVQLSPTTDRARAIEQRWLAMSLHFTARH